MNDNVVDHHEIHDKDADLKRRGVSQSPGGVLIKKLHILRSVIGTIFPVEACIMSGHYGSLIADNRSRCALSAVRSITGRAGDFQIYRVALYCIASHRIAETYCLRARKQRFDAISVVNHRACGCISRDEESEVEIQIYVYARESRWGSLNEAP